MDLHLERGPGLDLAARRRVAVGQAGPGQAADGLAARVALVVIPVRHVRVERLRRVDELGLLRAPVVDLQQVAVERGYVSHLGAVAVGHEAVVLAQGVALVPAHAHELGLAGRHRVLQGLGARIARQQAQQLAIVPVTAGALPGQGVQVLLDQQVRDRARADQRHDLVGVVASRDGQVGLGAAGCQGGDGIAPCVQAERVHHTTDGQRTEEARVVGAPQAAGEECGLRVVAPPRPYLQVRVERRVLVDDQRQPRRGLVALVDVVVDQAGVPGQRDPLARAEQIGLVHHPVLEVAQLVGSGAEQLEQRLVQVCLAGGLPPRHAAAHPGDQRVDEGIVVLGQVVDRRVGDGRRRGRPVGRAVVEAPGPELELDLAKERVDLVKDQPQAVRRSSRRSAAPSGRAPWQSDASWATAVTWTWPANGPPRTRRPPLMGKIVRARSGWAWTAPTISCTWLSLKRCSSSTASVGFGSGRSETSTSSMPLLSPRFLARALSALASLMVMLSRSPAGSAGSGCRRCRRCGNGW